MESDLLNKGLNFAIPPQCAPLADVVNSVENSIQYRNHSLKSAVRYNVKKCLLNKKHNGSNRSSFDEWCTNRKLKTRNVIYSRADKGNAVVIYLYL